MEDGEKLTVYVEISPIGCIVLGLLKAYDIKNADDEQVDQMYEIAVQIWDVIEKYATFGVQEGAEPAIVFREPGGCFAGLYGMELAQEVEGVN